MQKKEYEIFISYRREGGADKARTLKTELESRGYKVFLDFDELKNGVFDKRIMYAIDSSPIFMFLLTPNSLDRCINEDDWVRREIEYAVDNHKHIVPINPDRTFNSLPDNLSEKIKEGLGLHQFTDVMFGQLFKASISELINNSIRPILTKWGRENAATTKGATIHIETDLDCRILRFGKEIGLAQAGEYSEVKVPKGKHKLEFIGLENTADKYEHLLTVEDLEYEDFIEVKLLDKYNARKEREDAELKAREETERKARDEAERKAEQKRVEIELRNKINAEAKRVAEEITEAAYKTEQECKAREEATRNAALRRKETEKQNKLKINSTTYLLGLPDDEFEKVQEKGKYGFKLKSTKEIVIPPVYDFVVSFSNGLAMVRFNMKWGWIDKTGKRIIPLKYNDAYSFSEGLAKVEINGKWGFIDKTGKEVIPLKYDDVVSFSEGLAVVKLYDKWGYIDKTDKEIIYIQYCDAWPFVNGKAKVILNGERFYIDKNGNRVNK